MLTIASVPRRTHLYNIGAKMTQLKGKIVQFVGSYWLLAERDVVWRALNDVSVLKEVIPGCDHIDWTGPSTLDLSIKVNLGVMHPKFNAELELSDVNPAQDYILTGRGRGGIVGGVKGQAHITLSNLDLGNLPLDQINSAIAISPDAQGADEIWSRTGTGTTLQFDASGGASGQIMALGKALVGKSAQKIIDGFFVRFARAMKTSIRRIDLRKTGNF